MSFSDWKKRSKQFTDLHGRFGQSHLGAIEAACQAAYKAGERQGRKDAEAVARNPVELALRLCEARRHGQLSPTQQKLVEDLRSNVQVQRDAACGGSAGT